MLALACGSSSCGRASGPQSAKPDVPSWVAGASLSELLAEFYDRYDEGYDSEFVAKAVQDVAGEVAALSRSATDEDRFRIATERVWSRIRFEQSEIGHGSRPDRALRRSADCLGASTLVLMVCEELGLRASAIVDPVPGHVVVTYKGVVRDATDRGRVVSPRLVSAWVGVGSESTYGVPITSRQLLSYHVSNLAAMRGHDPGTSNGNLAVILGSLGRLAWSLDDRNFSAHAVMAVHWELSGDRDEALWHSARAVALNPTSILAWKLREKLAKASGEVRIQADAVLRIARLERTQTWVAPVFKGESD